MVRLGDGSLRKPLAPRPLWPRPLASLPGQPPGLEPKGPPAAAYVSCSRSGGQAWPKETLVSVGGACFDQGNLSADQVQGSLGHSPVGNALSGVLMGASVKRWRSNHNHR